MQQAGHGARRAPVLVNPVTFLPFTRNSPVLSFTPCAAQADAQERRCLSDGVPMIKGCRRKEKVPKKARTANTTGPWHTAATTLPASLHRGTEAR